MRFGFIEKTLIPYAVGFLITRLRESFFARKLVWNVVFGKIRSVGEKVFSFHLFLEEVGG